MVSQAPKSALIEHLLNSKFNEIKIYAANKLQHFHGEDVKQALLTAINDKSPCVRSMAATTLGHHSSDAIIDILLDRLFAENDTAIFAAKALAYHEDPIVIQTLIEQLDELVDYEGIFKAAPFIREAIAEALGEWNSKLYVFLL